MASASSISRRLRSRIAGESAWPTVVIPSDAPASAAISSKNSASTPGQSSTRTLPHSRAAARDRKSTRLNSSHLVISYAVCCVKKKKRVTLVQPVGVDRAVDQDGSVIAPEPKGRKSHGHAAHLADGTAEGTEVLGPAEEGRRTE